MTSIEFLKEKLTSVFVNDEGFNKLFEQAKEMHKQEIIDAYNEGESFPQSYLHSKNYYEETFKKD